MATAPPVQFKRLVSELDSVLSIFVRYQNTLVSNVRGQEAALCAGLTWKPDSPSAPTSFLKMECLTVAGPLPPAGPFWLLVEKP